MDSLSTYYPGLLDDGIGQGFGSVLVPNGFMPVVGEGPGLNHPLLENRDAGWGPVQTKRSYTDGHDEGMSGPRETVLGTSDLGRRE